MTEYKKADYHEINTYCRSEGLDTEYILYEMKAAKRTKRWKLRQLLVSMLR